LSVGGYGIKQGVRLFKSAYADYLPKLLHNAAHSKTRHALKLVGFFISLNTIEDLIAFIEQVHCVGYLLS
jgi:hypothetical protein